MKSKRTIGSKWVVKTPASEDFVLWLMSIFLEAQLHVSVNYNKCFVWPRSLEGGMFRNRTFFLSYTYVCIIILGRAHVTVKTVRNLFVVIVSYWSKNVQDWIINHRIKGKTFEGGPEKKISCYSEAYLAIFPLKNHKHAIIIPRASITFFIYRPKTTWQYSIITSNMNFWCVVNLH